MTTYRLVKVNLNEISMSRFMKTHDKNGYIIVTAFRDSFSYIDNQKRNDILVRKIKNSGYTYLPVFGGFV